MIDAVDPGIKLYVRNKHPEGMTQFAAQKTLLFVHGATSPGEATFDFPLEGLSWMDHIAQRGWDVYLVDVRGYGRSTRPPEMDQPAASNPPIVTTDVAVRDVGSAIASILQRRGVSKLSLVGWSWGQSSPELTRPTTTTRSTTSCSMRLYGCKPRRPRKLRPSVGRLRCGLAHAGAPASRRTR
ncbi:alpha/beta hydrolase [Bradyrhizobium sp. RDT10]